MLGVSLAFQCLLLHGTVLAQSCCDSPSSPSPGKDSSDHQTHLWRHTLEPEQGEPLKYALQGLLVKVASTDRYQPACRLLRAGSWLDPKRASPNYLLNKMYWFGVAGFEGQVAQTVL